MNMEHYSHNRVFASACMGMLVFGIAFLSLGTVSTFLQNRFGPESTGFASLASTLPFGMLAGTILFGPLADRYGYKFLLVLSCLLIVAAFEMIAFAPSLFVAQLSFFLIGLGGGVINGATNALASDITAESKGARLSLLGVFFGIGALGMPLLMGVMTKSWDYGTVISLVGWIIFVPFILFIFTRFPEPKHKQGFPVKEGLALLREPVLFLMGMILFFESGLEGIISNWTTTYLSNGNVPVAKALFALSVQVAALVTARFFLSRLLKQYSPALLLSCSILLVFTGSLMMFFGNGFVWALLALILFGFGFAAGFPVILGFTGEIFPHLTGTAFGIVIIMALIGNTFLNWITGLLSSAGNISYFPLLTGACALIMFLLLRIAIPRIKKKQSLI